jgi:trimethylamine--corrinoid protein Co-methyltransferase
MIPFPDALFKSIGEDAVCKIHEAGMRILQAPGIRIEDPKIRERLFDRGCAVAGERVAISRDCAQNALSRVTRRLALTCPGGTGVNLQPNYTATHTTGGMPYIIDRHSGRRRYARSADLISLTHLINGLEQLDINCAMTYLEDVPPAINQLKQCELLLRFSLKPIYIALSSPRQLEYMVELFRVAETALLPAKDRALGILGISPESPLYFPQSTTAAIETAVAADIPVVMLPAPIAGFTSPLTIAGSLAQQHASMLAFTCIADLIKTRSRLIYGARLAFTNMRTGNSIWGLPEVGMSGAAAAQLARHSGFLSDVYGFSSSACTCDHQAGYEKALNGILPVLAGANLISGFGGLASLTTASHEQLVIDNETFRTMMRITRGFRVNADTLAEDVIASAASGEDYVTSGHTIRHLKAGELFIPELAFDDIWQGWTPPDNDHIRRRAKDRAETLLREPMENSMSREAEKEFNRIMAAARTALIQ